MPKRAETRPDAWTRPALAQRLDAAADPEARVAVEALTEAAWRLFNATGGGGEAAALLRFMADDLDALFPVERPEPRPAHRPVGSTQYDPAALRAAMDWAQHHVLPPGSKRRQDRLLARTLWHLQRGRPGGYGASEDGIYRRILRLREEDERARRAAAAELGTDAAKELGSLAAFLFRGPRTGEP